MLNRFLIKNNYNKYLRVCRNAIKKHKRLEKFHYNKFDIGDEQTHIFHLDVIDGDIYEYEFQTNNKITSNFFNDICRN